MAMVAATNTRARGRAAMPTVGSGVMALINQPDNQPKYEYREVGIGGRLEDIRLSDQIVDGKFIQGQKIGEKWVGQTFMKLRDVAGHPNQLGWWIDELEREVIIEHYSLSMIHRTEMIERSNPAFVLLGDWLNMERDLKAKAMIPLDPNKPIPDDWMELLRRNVEAIKDSVIVYEAVTRAVVISPPLVDTKDEEKDGALWIKRFSEERMIQLFDLLDSPLRRVQEYFREARG